MNKKVIIVGGEGNGGVIASCIEDNRIRFSDTEWLVQGFINDFEKEVCGYPVLGGLKDISGILRNEDYYIMWAIHMIGRNILTEKLFVEAEIPPDRLATIVHKTAFVAQSAILEPGVFVMANSYIGPQAYLGTGTLVMSNAMIGHNTTVGSLCHFSVGSITSSYVNIGLCSDITLGARVLEKVSIGKFSIAGAGCVVTKDIPDYEVHVGIPARFLKNVKRD